MTDKKYSVSVAKLPNSMVDIVGEIPFPELEKHRKDVLKHLSEHVDIAGFRKGHVPESVLVQRVGALHILQDMAERALEDAYPEIVSAEHIEPLGYPEITLTKLAPGNPLGFSMKIAIKPEVKLPDYRAIAQSHTSKKEDASVTDGEFEKSFNHVREQLKKPGEEIAPEITDELVQGMGGDFKNLEDFKTQLREKLLEEKKERNREKLRLSIAEEIIENTAVEMPQILIETELAKMEAQFKEDIERMGLNLTEYLEKIKKTEEGLREDWKPDALKRAKLQLVLNAIARAENITPDTELVAKEVAHVLEHYPDLDPLRVRLRVETMLENNLVFEFLEKLQ